MPVDDHPIHPSTQHDRPVAGCHNRPNGKTPYYVTAFGQEVYDRFTTTCRQIGHKVCGVWHPLDECDGCTAEKDEAYIAKSRNDIDLSSRS